ncbi:hypothetical protein fugu_000812 [Takifugu bimaculatus]|uniref:Uncharacterized protein n=1 Tax=Takifugu bimaculatus TaxID=433685 RepID=A0A4Z2CHQ2_9TELE|nr:hypothetical protein fugu_000812 [Takifugu bimaculatus]
MSEEPGLLQHPPPTVFLKKARNGHWRTRFPHLWSNPGACLSLIPSSSRRLQMTSTAAALASEPALPGNPETPPALSQSMSQHQLRACWSSFPGICIVPGYKSSKKCLISEMSQEPRPVSRDCVYPALVGCSAPVEAVLSQISSNMWSRGFGQLVRARNIKTVGDLSALTATEIKTLPIRSPKISNVKKALKNYEQQRKGRGSDELKSFDETEKMTSDPDASTPPHQDEENKVPGDTLATELVDEPLPADWTMEADASGNGKGTVETSSTEPGPDGRLAPGGSFFQNWKASLAGWSQNCDTAHPSNSFRSTSGWET